MSDFREEEFSPSPLEAAGNQEVLDFTTSPFTIKGACILTQAREFFGSESVDHLTLLQQFSSYNFCPKTEQ